MLDVILQILSIIGIILLSVLLLGLVLLLLVLFFPITYRVTGQKEEVFRVAAKVRWLFGMLRIKYSYPQPGRLTVKCLWLTLFDRKIPGDGESEAEEEAKQESKKSNKTKSKGKKKKGEKAKTAEVSNNTEGGTGAEKTKESTTKGATGGSTVEASQEGESSKETGSSNEMGSSKETDTSNETDADALNNVAGKILKKIEKIKYTIRSIYDKIREIWKNISYYTTLLQEENTRQLFSHVCLRLGKILKSILPRHIKADIVFGTGSPDTTGYLYGVYGMFCSALGKDVAVTPDFEQAVFGGSFDVSGHITVWVILINALKLLFDQKLHLFIEKVKAGRKTEKQQAQAAQERGENGRN